MSKRSIIKIRVPVLSKIIHFILLVFLISLATGCGGGSGSGSHSAPIAEGSNDASTVPLTSGTILSTTPFNGTDGDDAYKGKLISLTYQTGGGGYEKPLVVVYGDAAGPEVWDFKGSKHRARDIFVTRSLDNGVTWSQPVNISNMANLSSAAADNDGDPVTPPVPYYGDADKPIVYGNEKNIVVLWGEKYAPGGNQGSVVYPDAGLIEVPYSCLYVARSTDGGVTWSSPQQLTDGYRDIEQYVVQASGAGFAIVWQEDPRGLQPGEAEGPGEGGSGAKVSKGTDIWYSALTRAALVAGNPFPAPVRVTNNFISYDKNGVESGQVGASRPNIFLTGSILIIAYEETKGSGETDSGKYVRYHVFSSFVDPLSDPTGGEGWIISDTGECARRVRVFAQDKAGTNSGVRTVFLWRQGEYTQGAPADIMARVGIQNKADAASTGFRPEDLFPSVDPLSSTPAFADNNLPPMNLSSSLGINALTGDDPNENAMAHRGIVRGDFIAVGFSWTPDGNLASTTNEANYNFFITRSFDGGKTWDESVNITNITDKSINVKEPRIVGTPSSPDPVDIRDTSTYFVAWSTELKDITQSSYQAVDLDVFFTKTKDNGETYGPVQLLAGGPSAQYECQMRASPDGSQLQGIWMETSAYGKTDVMLKSIQLKE